MKIGIVGAGFMGSMHARIWSGIEGCSLGGIASLSGERARKLAAQVSAPCAVSYTALLKDPSIDLVDVCAPTGTHAELACRAMESGKDVVVEFPVCASAAELEKMAETSLRTGRVCAAAYYTRYQSQYSAFFDLVRSGKIGTLRKLHVSRKCSSVFSGPDIANDLLSQDIDCAVRLLGLPEDVSCASLLPDYCAVHFSYPDCAVSVEGFTAMHSSFPFTTRHEAAGSAGSLDLDWQFTDRPEYALSFSGIGGPELIEVPDYDPYEFELKLISRGIRESMTADFDIHSVRDAALLAFRCRELASAGLQA